MDEYSAEALTAMEMIETLAPTRKKVVVEKLRNLIHEEKADEKWNELSSKETSQHILDLANEAKREFDRGESTDLNFE